MNQRIVYFRVSLTERIFGTGHYGKYGIWTYRKDEKGNGGNFATRSFMTPSPFESCEARQAHEHLLLVQNPFSLSEPAAKRI